MLPLPFLRLWLEGVVQRLHAYAKGECAKLPALSPCPKWALALGQTTRRANMTPVSLPGAKSFHTRTNTLSYECETRVTFSASNDLFGPAPAEVGLPLLDFFGF